MEELGKSIIDRRWRIRVDEAAGTILEVELSCNAGPADKHRKAACERFANDVAEALVPCRKYEEVDGANDVCHIRPRSEVHDAPVWGMAGVVNKRLLGSVSGEGERRFRESIADSRPRRKQFPDSLSRDVLANEQGNRTSRQAELRTKRYPLRARCRIEAIEVDTVVDPTEAIVGNSDLAELGLDIVAHHREAIDSSQQGRDRTRGNTPHELTKFAVLPAQAGFYENRCFREPGSDHGAQCRCGEAMCVNHVDVACPFESMPGHCDRLRHFCGVKRGAAFCSASGERKPDPFDRDTFYGLAVRESVDERRRQNAHVGTASSERSRKAERLLLRSGDVRIEPLRNHQHSRTRIRRIRFAVHFPEIIMTGLEFSGGSMNTPLCLARVLMLLVCISAPLTHCFAQPPVEPSWNGKYLAYYLGELKNPNAVQRQLAAEAIGHMGSTAAGAVPELTKLLDSKDVSDRIAGAFALAKIGEASKPALPALQKMAASTDVNEKKVAQLAIAAIEPPAMAGVVDFFSSVYVLSILIAIGAGSLVAFILWRRKVPKKPKIPDTGTPSKSAQTSPTSKDDGGTKSAASDTTDAAASPVAGAPATSTSASQYRKRVSRQLPGMASYISEQEGPDTVKRELARAQDEFKRLCDKQQEIAKYFNSEELNKDPERMRKLRLESDELALQHYRSEIRFKALEVKMLEMLVDHGGASDATLRDRTEATIKQKWEDLRTLCETPAKTVWKAEQWVSVATGQHTAIPDLRAHLSTYDVVIVERSTAPFDVAPEAASVEEAAAAAPEESSAAIAGDPPASTEDRAT